MMNLGFTPIEFVKGRHPMSTPKISPVIRQFSETVDDIGLPLFTDRKSHTGFPLVAESVTLNDRTNGVIAVISRYLAGF